MSAIYLAGLIQGVVLVAFPAASTLFTSAQAFDFSSTQYGALFAPQSIMSIAASIFSAKMSRRFGAQAIYYAGLLANAVSMSLFAFSALIIKETYFVFPLLLVATSCLGIGFGLTVPIINTMAAQLRPKQVNTVILILNALLGVGTVLAPLFISVFIAFGLWWGLPILLVVSLLCLIGYSLQATFPSEKTHDFTPSVPLPKKAFVFMGFALLYGIVETLNGNWAAIYMREIQQASIQAQSLALTIFWAAVTLGRIFFACFQRNFPGRRVYQVLPIVVVFAFIVLAMLPPGNPYASLCAIGLAGLGCSALLPLTISFGTSQLPSISRSVAAMVVASYLLGYGIAAFATGVVLDLTAYTLSGIYGFSSLAALVLAVLAFFITRRRIV